MFPTREAPRAARDLRVLPAGRRHRRRPGAARRPRGCCSSAGATELGAAYDGKAVHPVGDRARRRGARASTCRARSSRTCCCGVESDLRARADRDLRRRSTSYCYRVASTVGLLLVRVLGLPRARARSTTPRRWASRCSSPTCCATSARTPRAGRVYLAREDLERFGVEPSSRSRADPTPDELRAAARLLRGARAHLLRARRAALRPDEDRARLRPADAMGAIYRALLDELQRARFPPRRPRCGSRARGGSRSRRRSGCEGARA